MSILAIIPARGGSKGIPGKNIKLLANKPLVAYTIEAALKVKEIDSLILSTDDTKIAEIGAAYGAQVPFLRPKELARDESNSVDTVFHVLSKVKNYENILLLQPTSPLRNSEDIRGIINYKMINKCSSVVSVSKSKKPPECIYHIDKNDVLKPTARTFQRKSFRSLTL